MSGIQGDAMCLRIQGWIRNAIAVTAILGCAVVMTPGVFAQTATTGSINGSVVDSTGAVVPGATVTLKDDATGAIQTLTTNAEGRFIAPYLKPDPFEISATAPGLQSPTKTIQVLTGQQTGVDITVAPASSSQTVQVTANNAQLIDTQTANLITTFTTQQFQNLPAPGGDITTIAYTVPGVVAGAGTQGFGAISSDGLPGLSNLVLINGADYNVSLYGGINYSGASNNTIGQQEIAQVAVVQNGYSVQYGRQAGIIETFTTKSGSNRVHGLAQWDYNSAGLNANDFFNNQTGTPRAKAVSNQYAAQIGGPIKHDKLFFFADTEGLRFVLPTTGFINLPSQTLMNSVLANPNLSAATKSLYGAMFNATKGSAAYKSTVPVVTGPGIFQDATGSYGCGGLDAKGNPTPGGLYGTPDYATGGTLGSSAAESCVDAGFINTGALNTEYMVAGRLDWNINDHHLIFFRVTTDQGSQASYTSLINPAWNQISIQPSWTGQMNDTYTFSPNLTNQFIAAALVSAGVFKPANQDAALAASPAEFDQAFNGGTNITPGIGQATFFTASTTLGSPWIDFPGGVNALQYQVSDGLSWLKGNHNIRFGGDFRRYDFSDVSFLTAAVAGDYIFGGMADEFGGSLPGVNGSQFFQSFSNFGNAHMALYNVGLYAQDEWRAAPNLTLDFGIRFDRNGNPLCNDSCFSQYLGGFPAKFAAGTDPLTVPYNQTISAGHGSFVPSMEWGIITPRGGFNWDVAGNGKTVVRGGVGLFSDNFPALITEQTFLSFPNRYASFVKTGTVGVGPGTAQGLAAAGAAAVLKGFSQGATYDSIAAQVPGFSPPNYSTTPHTFHGARYVEYSMQLQRAITPTDAVILSYAGNHGYDLYISNNHINQNVGNSFYGLYGAGTFDGLPANSPDPRFGQVTTFTNNAVSNYNGISVQYKHFDHHGFTTNVSYTYSHSLDDISNGGNSQLPYKGISIFDQMTPNSVSQLMYSNSDYDVRHSFLLDAVYVEPYHFDNKLVNFAAAGWTVGAKAYWRSGQPFSVVNGNAETALSTSGSGGSTVLATVLNNNFNHFCNSFSKPCFQTPGIFNGQGLAANYDNAGNFIGVVPSGPGPYVQTNFGNVPRNAFYGPHYADVDVNLYKDVFKKGDLQFQVGAQAFNVLNHVNFAAPSGNASSQTLGTISGDVAPPTSPYGSSQSPSVVSGRILVVQGRLLF
jgi:hypothetical protein